MCGIIALANIGETSVDRNLFTKLSSYIDHTILKPEATKADVIKICDEAKEYNFAAVCVNGAFTKLVSRKLQDTDINVAVVIGFPLGINDSAVKAYETKKAILCRMA